jgi:ketosteroid isomerase-like protein
MKHCPACHRCYEDAQTACAEDQSALIESRPGPPALAGKYRLEEFLGRGDQGTAYGATALGDGRSVIAVELVRAEVLNDPQALERFHAAAQAAGRNNGQEVGGIRDSGSLPGGGAYVVMELIDGDADGQEDAAAAPGQSDTPAVLAQGPETGPLRPLRRNTGKLTKVAAEITQEVRRIPLPIPPVEASRVAAEEATPARDAGITREVSAPPKPRMTSSLPAASRATREPSAPMVADVRRKTTRLQPTTFYFGLALIGLACLLLLLYAFSRVRFEPAATTTTDPATTQTSASQPEAPPAPPTQQAAAPSSGQSGPSAAGPADTSPAAPTVGGAVTTGRSTSRGAGREAEVRELLDDWVAAVVARDVDRLMTFYSTELETFHGRRDVKSSSLRAELGRLFGRAESVEARVLGEPQITFEEGGRVATTRVRLSYTIEDKRGRKRRGEVAQELRLVKIGNGWKISGQGGENMLH